MNATRQISTPVFAGLSFENVRAAVIFLFAASSFFVVVEPAPVDLLFFVALLFFLRSGLNISFSVAPLVLLLVLYNLGGFTSAIPVVDKPKTMMFVLTSTYMALSAIFLAFYIAHDPIRHFRILRIGIIVAGLFAAMFALIDYMQLFGLFDYNPLKGRATGTFKDPNVFSTFTILPAMLLMHGLMTGETKHKFLSLIGLLITSGAIFLAFSRGAWVNYLMSAVLICAFTFIVTPSARTRGRVIFFVVSAIVGGIVAFSILMSVQSIREMFLMRFSLLQSYDAGETGRFGKQLQSIPLLFTSPLGFGPLQFAARFGNDPHNTLINSFASYGWLGGISYITLLASTIVAGFKAVFTRSPWQYGAIVVFCPMLSTMFQGIQIDTDHWRHFYWQLGLVWGFFAATEAYAAGVFDRRTLRPLQHHILQPVGA